MLDGLSLAATLVALHLDVLENAWRKHVFLNLDTMAVAAGACLYLSVCTATALAFLSNRLLLKLEFSRLSVEELLHRTND